MDDQAPAGSFAAQHRGGLLLIGLLALLLVTLVVVLTTTSTSVPRTPQGGPSPDQTRSGGPPAGGLGHDALPEKEACEDLLPAGGPAFTDGEGMIVGEDVAAGTYRQAPGSAPDGATCFYVIYADPSEATVLRTGAEEGDVVDSHDCGDWLPLETTYPETLATRFDTGMYVVGGHIESGTYELTWNPDSAFCSWGIFSDLRGDSAPVESSIIPQDAPESGEPLEVTLDARDHLIVTTETCGTWSKVD